MQATTLGEIASSNEVCEIACRSFEVETFGPVQEGDWNDAYSRFMEMMG